MTASSSASRPTLTLSARKRSARRRRATQNNGASETRPHEFDELWQRRLALVREIVDVPATKIYDPVFKAILLTSCPC
jgi:hypothetical protein